MAEDYVRLKAQKDAILARGDRECAALVKENAELREALETIATWAHETVREDIRRLLDKRKSRG